MSVVVEITNPVNLAKAKDLLGAKSDSETLELALEIVIKDYESKESSASKDDLPDDFFEDLFAEKTNLHDGESVHAVVREREESNF
jgi:hypothetical protein